MIKLPNPVVMLNLVITVVFSVEVTQAQDMGQVIRTDQLQMTGLHPGARVIRTEQLQMTGLGKTATGSATAVTEEIPQLGPPQLHELEYPVAEFAYPTYEMTGAVTDF